MSPSIFAANPNFTEVSRNRIAAPIRAVAISADESLLAAVAGRSGDAWRVRLYDRRTMKRLGSLEAEVGGRPRLLFSPRAELILVYGAKALELWEVPESPLHPDKPLDSRLRRWAVVAESAEVTAAAIGEPARTVTWISGRDLYRRSTERGDISQNDPLWRGAVDAPPPMGFSITPGGGTVALLRKDDKSIALLEKGHPGISRMLAGHRFPVSAVSHDSSGSLLSIDTGHSLLRWRDQREPSATAFLDSIPDGRTVTGMIPLAAQYWVLQTGETGAAPLVLNTEDGKVTEISQAGSATAIAASPTGRYFLTGSDRELVLYRFAHPVAPVDYVRKLGKEGAFQVARKFAANLDRQGLDEEALSALDDELDALPAAGLTKDDIRDRLRVAQRDGDGEAVRFWAGKLLAVHEDDPDALKALAGLEDQGARRILDKAREAMAQGRHRSAIRMIATGIAPESPLYEEAEAQIREAEQARRQVTAVEQAREKMNLGNLPAAEAIVGQVLRDDAEHPAALALMEEIDNRGGRILGFQPGWAAAVLAVVIGGLVATATRRRWKPWLHRLSMREPPLEPVHGRSRAAAATGSQSRNAAGAAGAAARNRRSRTEHRQEVEGLLQKTEEMVRLFRQADTQNQHTTMLLEYEAELHSLHRRVVDRTANLDTAELRLKQMQSHLRRVQFQHKPSAAAPQIEDASTDEELSHYELLRVPPDASHEVIKAAYHQRLKEYHPDLHSSSEFDWIKSEAERMSRRVGEAYEVLADGPRREQYDRQLRRKRRPAT